MSEAPPSDPMPGPVEVVRAHPIATLFFVLCVLGGALLSYVLIGDESLSPVRRIAGGALMGGIGYLLAMISRLY